MIVKSKRTHGDLHGYLGKDSVENSASDVHLSWLPWRQPLGQDNSLLHRVVHRCGQYNWLHSSELANHGVRMEAARWRCQRDCDWDIDVHNGVVVGCGVMQQPACLISWG